MPDARFDIQKIRNVTASGVNAPTYVVDAPSAGNPGSATAENGNIITNHVTFWLLKWHLLFKAPYNHSSWTFIHKILGKASLTNIDAKRKPAIIVPLLNWRWLRVTFFKPQVFYSLSFLSHILLNKLLQNKKVTGLMTALCHCQKHDLLILCRLKSKSKLYRYDILDIQHVQTCSFLRPTFLQRTTDWLSEKWNSDHKAKDLGDSIKSVLKSTCVYLSWIHIARLYYLPWNAYCYSHQKWQ